MVRKIYLRFILSINSSIACSETPLEALNMIIAEMTSNDRFINEDLDEVRVRRSIVLL